MGGGRVEECDSLCVCMEASLDGVHVVMDAGMPYVIDEANFFVFSIQELSN